MKKLIYIVLLLAACKGPEKKAVTTTVKDTAQQTENTDTVFIERGADDGDYHAIYIEKNRESRAYKALQYFKYDRDDSTAYKQNYKILKIRFSKPLRKYDLAGLPKKWLPLYLYKGNYYLYSPCDAGNAGIRTFTDSTLIYYNTDGPDPKPILDFKKVNERTYTIKSLPFYQFVKSSNIIIHVIDPKNMITVWEDKILPEPYRYRLYVAKENAANFDMVVNQSVSRKMPEYQFEKINYKALLKDK